MILRIIFFITMIACGDTTSNMEEQSIYVEVQPPAEKKVPKQTFFFQSPKVLGNMLVLHDSVKMEFLLKMPEEPICMGEKPQVTVERFLKQAIAYENPFEVGGAFSYHPFYLGQAFSINTYWEMGKIAVPLLPKNSYFLVLNQEGTCGKPPQYIFIDHPENQKELLYNPPIAYAQGMVKYIGNLAEKVDIKIHWKQHLVSAVVSLQKAHEWKIPFFSGIDEFDGTPELEWVAEPKTGFEYLPVIKWPFRLQTKEIDLMLDTRPQGIQILVKNPAGAPVANLKVVLKGKVGVFEVTQTKESNEQGLAEFQALKGQYEIWGLDAKGQVVSLKPALFTVNQPQILSVQTSFPERKTYWFYVKNALGAPVAQALVQLQTDSGTQKEVLTGDLGEFSADLEPGAYRIQIKPPDGSLYPYFYTKIQVPEDAKRTFQIPKTQIVPLQVVYADKTPAALAVVRLYRLSMNKPKEDPMLIFEGYTNETGNIQIPILSK